MMEHEEARLLLSEYLDDSLAEADRQGVEAHLNACDQCRQELGLLRSALSIVRKLPRPKAPEHFVGRVQRRARKAGLTYARRGRRSAQRMLLPIQSSMTLAVLLAAVGAMIVMVLLLHGQIQLSVQQPPVVIPVADLARLNQVADLAWRFRGRVLVAGREVPAGSLLGAVSEVDLILPVKRWPAFIELLKKTGLAPDLPDVQTGDKGSGVVSALVRVQRQPASPREDGR